jgi:ribosomal protein S17
VLKKVAKIKKTIHQELILSKTKYWSILIEENEINVGDTILIKE